MTIKDNFKPVKRLVALTLFWMLLLRCETTSGVPHKTHPLPEPNPASCTTAIISGSATVDGRPMLFKVRDVGEIDQEFVYFNDGEFDYIAVTNAGDSTQAFGGVNSAGFAVENSSALNLPNNVGGADDDGIIMKLALQTCRTVDDFTAILDSTDNTGRTYPSNYGVIDAEGNAVIFEAGSDSYEIFRADDEDDAPLGILVRSNFAYTGDDNDRVGVWRHDRMYELLRTAIEGDSLTPEYILRHVAADIALEDLNPYPLPFDSVYAGREWPHGYLPVGEAVSRDDSRSALLVQGVLEGEDASQSILFAFPGPPLFSVPIPMWIASHRTPEQLNGDSTALLCDIANRFKNLAYNSRIASDALNTYQLNDGYGGGILPVLQPVVDTILARIGRTVAEWREELPDSAELAGFQNEIAAYASDRLGSWSSPTVLEVPDDYETIQAAIDAASEGDTVLVSPGIYPAPVEFRGRNVTVASRFLTTRDAAYIDSTVIDGRRNGRSGAIFRDGETSLARLCGFTVQNCSTDIGGGVYINGSNPTLSYLVLRSNKAERGAGVYCTREAVPRLENVTVFGNSASDEGGGLHCYDQNSSATLVNSIHWGNAPSVLPEWVTAGYSDIEGGFAGEGNVAGDPLFTDEENGILHLGWENFPVNDSTRSPCIDSGDPESPLDWDQTRADMGALFFNQGLPPSIGINRDAIEFVDIPTQTYAFDTVAIENLGDRMLSVASQSIITIEGPPFIYIRRGGGSFDLGDGESHLTVIAFAPQIEERHAAIYRIESNAVDRPVVEIPVTGVALTANRPQPALPNRPTLSAAYPNPFNSLVSLRFGIPSPADCNLSIVDIEGRTVAALISGRREPGWHGVSWNAESQPSGLYFARLVAPGRVLHRRLVLVR